MNDIISDYIFSNQFKRFGHQILFKNETSGTVFTQYQLIVIKEIKENGLVLELPSNQCQKGHTLSLYFFNQDYKFKTINFLTTIKDSEFEIIGKVDLVTENSPVSKMATIEITFVQYNVKKWKMTLEQYNKNQDQINDLLAKQHLDRSEDE